MTIKDSLRNYSLAVENIDLITISSINNVYKCYCREGVFIAKEYLNESLFNVNSVIVHEKLNKLINLTPKIVKTKNNSLFSYQDGKYTLLTNFVENKEYGKEKTSEICYLLKYLHKRLEHFYFSETNYKKDYHQIQSSLERYQKNNLCMKEKELLNIRKTYNMKFKFGYSPKVFSNIHGDFKKENVLLNNQNKFQVIDFDYVGYKDLYVEVCRAACEFSEFDDVLFFEFLMQYFNNKNTEVYKCILDYFTYLIFSDFPLGIKNIINTNNYYFLLNNRIMIINFIYNQLIKGGIL